MIKKENKNRLVGFASFANNGCIEISRKEAQRMKDTINYLQEKYGPLMSLEALAETLDRSTQGLRVSLHSQSELSMAINATKRKLGRRIYFKTTEIAKIVDGDSLIANIDGR